jgi:hypothetical protein
MCNLSTQTLCNAYIHDSLHWRATMNSFRLTTVKKTMLIYVHSFLFINLQVEHILDKCYNES